MACLIILIVVRINKDQGYDWSETEWSDRYIEVGFNEIDRKKWYSIFTTTYCRGMQEGHVFACCWPFARSRTQMTRHRPGEDADHARSERARLAWLRPAALSVAAGASDAWQAAAALDGRCQMAGRAHIAWPETLGAGRWRCHGNKDQGLPYVHGTDGGVRPWSAGRWPRAWLWSGLPPSAMDVTALRQGAGDMKRRLQGRAALGLACVCICTEGEDSERIECSSLRGGGGELGTIQKSRPLALISLHKI